MQVGCIKVLLDYLKFLNLGNFITPLELCIPFLLKIKSSGSDSL